MSTRTATLRNDGCRFGRRLAAVCTLAIVVGIPRSVLASDIVIRGFDLFDPLPGTVVFLDGLGLVPFIGSPLGSFDFGAGPIPTGTTDTIIERLDDAMAPMDTVPIAIRAMQLVTAAPIDIGFGLNLYFLTLDPLMPSTGTMTFTDFSGSHGPPPPSHGTFNYGPITWNFVVREGTLAGTIRLSDTQTLTSGPIAWSHFPPPGALLIPGVNSGLGPCPDGPPLCDFFPIQTFALTSAEGTTILTRTAPEPGPIALLTLGTIWLTVRARRRIRRP
jgi:hypothetical protein